MVGVSQPQHGVAGAGSASDCFLCCHRVEMPPTRGSPFVTDVRARITPPGVRVSLSASLGGALVVLVREIVAFPCRVLFQGGLVARLLRCGELLSR